MADTCSTCRFWVLFRPHHSEPEYNKGLCDKYWQITYAKAGCGEHQPKVKERDDGR